MDLKRYRVNNIQEALQLIKKDLGPEAVIVSTRQVKEGKGTFGLFGKTVLEVTAALDQEQKSAPAKTLHRLRQLLRCLWNQRSGNTALFQCGPISLNLHQRFAIAHSSHSKGCPGTEGKH